MKIKFTYVLIVLLIAVFVIELAFPAIVDALAFSPAEFGARPWSFLTAIFVHADLEHIVANLVVLWFFGLAVEKELGRSKALLVFLIGGFVGEISSVFLYAPDVLSLGASAGVFALIGVSSLVRPFELEAGNGWPMVAPLPLILLAMIYVAYNALGVFTGPTDIAYGAHFAGLAAGLIFGYFYRKRRV